MLVWARYTGPFILGAASERSLYASSGLPFSAGGSYVPLFGMYAVTAISKGRTHSILRNVCATQVFRQPARPPGRGSGRISPLTLRLFML